MKSDPYQWFFPLGMISGVVGVGLWIFYWLVNGAAYPGMIHADLMAAGFFLNVAMGFLLTALPKFSGTAAVGSGEKTLIFVLSIIFLALIFGGTRALVHGALFLESVLFVGFSARRIYKSHFRLPPMLLLTLCGFGATAVGSLLLFVGDMWPISAGIYRFGQLMQFYAAPLYLILGVGAQLLPMLMGHHRDVMTQTRPIFRVGLMAVGIGIGFLVEAAGYPVPGRVLCAGIAWTIILGDWKLYRRPRADTIVAKMVWLSGWMTVIGIGLPIAFPAYALLAAHLYFIGGISLLIVAVATRVVLAHGGHGLRLEKQSRALWVAFVLLVIAALVRCMAPLLPSGYQSHLAYAAMAWIAAVIAWSVVFFPRIVSRPLIVLVILSMWSLPLRAEEPEKDPMKIAKNGFVSFVATYDNRDYTMLTWRAAANFPHNFQYGGFINLFTSVPAPQNADLGVFYTEQNLYWAFAKDFPLGLNLQYLARTGPSNDLMRLALAWDPSKTPGIKPAFDWLHLWARINFNMLELYLSNQQAWDVQLEYLYRWDLFPKTFHKRVWLSGFADQNINMGGSPTGDDNVWVTEHLLSIRLVGGLCLAGRLRHEDFLPQQTGVGGGLQYVFKF